MRRGPKFKKFGENSCSRNNDTSQILRLTSDISNMSGLNRASYRALMRVGEGQEAPTRIWEKREGEERGHMA